jgi:hypothetical protein
MDPLTLPLEYAAIEKILPHRYPFLLVDRIIELENGQADRRREEHFVERALSDALAVGSDGAAADRS